MQTRIDHLGTGEMLLICPIKTENRLGNTCFRGKISALAGNFLHWETIEEVCEDDYIMKPMLARVVDLLNEQKLGVHRVSINQDIDIGWESTDELSTFSADELEEFKPNSRSNAFRVINPSQLGRKAPKTNKVTVIFELKLWGNVPVITILSLYPGEDIGELAGNITEQTKRVFYDWNHPGQ